MKYFDYFEPTSLNDAISLLLRYGDQGRPLAGGTDLLVKLSRREIKVDYLINLKRIPEINRIKYGDGFLEIGCITTINEIKSSPLIRDKFGVLSYAAGKLGSPQIRNLATIGGNICNASPAADMVPPLMVLGARLKIIGPEGERILPIERFFKGPSETVLNKGEILKSIEIPLPSLNTRSVYIKHSVRRAMDLAIVGVAIAVEIKDGICEDIRIGLGAVAPTPVRAERSEELMRGKEVNKELIEKVAEEASHEISPISDIRGSAEYRRDMVRVLTERGLKELIYGGEGEA